MLYQIAILIKLTPPRGEKPGKTTSLNQTLNITNLSPRYYINNYIFPCSAV